MVIAPSDLQEADPPQFVQCPYIRLGPRLTKLTLLAFSISFSSLVRDVNTVFVRCQLDGHLLIIWAMGQSIRLKFSKRLRELREKRGLTQQELAELSDLDYKHIQRLESRNPTDPKLETIEKLAKALKTTCSKLLDF